MSVGRSLFPVVLMYYYGAGGIARGGSFGRRGARASGKIVLTFGS